MVARAFLFFVNVYRRWISPLLRPRCRYLPTCSEYAKEALEKYGAWRGTRKTVGRLLRCHPFGSHG